jgi:hypothetical protein
MFSDSSLYGLSNSVQRDAERGVLLKETRRGVVYFVFYMTRWFFPPFSVVCAAGIVEINFSGAIE